MDELSVKELVAGTGRLLLKNGLVCRTWGNFSARLDGERFVITPGGLGYEEMKTEDVVTVSLKDGSFEGIRKPSSEVGIHAAAYSIFPEVGFVIHTHQCYASALSLTGPELVRASGEERSVLGGVGIADYGLPGTKKLRDAVTEVLKTGAHTVLMKHHGVLICGTDRADAIYKASVLEAICMRCCRRPKDIPEEQDISGILATVQKQYPGARAETDDAIRAWSALGASMFAQLDDVAQMIGPFIPYAKNEARLLALLKKHTAVFYPGVGAFVLGEDPGDTEALLTLVRKAAIAAFHTRILDVDARLGLFDSILMRLVYRFRYSKKKKG